jgi:hypothetical protein
MMQEQENNKSPKKGAIINNKQGGNSNVKSMVKSLGKSGLK